MRWRRPTEAQYRKLLALGSGAAWVVGSKRDAMPLIKRGWITAEELEPPTWMRITPDGLRALAAAVEVYGLPEMPSKKAA